MSASGMQRAANGLSAFEVALDQFDLHLEELLASNGDDYFHEVAQQLGEGWQALADQLAETGMPALMDLVAIHAAHFEAMCGGRADALSGAEQSLLQRWHQACRRYLQCPDDRGLISALAQLLSDPLWPEPLAGDDAAELIEGLVECAPLPQEIDEGGLALDLDDEPAIEPLAQREVVPVDIALVQMIASEFAKVADDLTHTLASFNCDSLAEYQQRLGANDFQLENINKACETVGLHGLSYLFRRLWLNVVTTPAADHNYDEECNLFGISLILIQEYLDDISNRERSSALVRHLLQPGWRRPLPGEMEQPLLRALNVPLVDPELQRSRLQRAIASAADVSLQIPEDVDGELVQTLLHELPLLTESFSAAIQEVIGDSASLEQLLVAQRVAHTLKGACNTIGVQGIANLTHSLETILEAFTTEQRLPGSELKGVLLDAADCLSAMSDALQGQGGAPLQALAILQQLLDWEYRIKREGLAGAEAEGGAESTPVAEAGQTAAEEEQAAAMTSLPVAMLDQIADAAAEAGSIGERIQDRFDGLLHESEEIREMTWRLTELVAEMDRLVNIQSVTARDSRRNQGFDTLEMEQYGEMHTCLSRLIEVAADVREHNAQVHRQLVDGRNLLLEHRAAQKLHLESVQRVRLVPVQRIVSRCQRIVRQTARMTGKEVALQISGEKTLVDSDILNGLADVLMHLLRNAVDHGIEAPQLRGQQGKPRQGTIRLSFGNHRNVLTIGCEDDGAGLDTERILASARGKGLVTEQQVLSEEQIQRLIFAPGFSTREQVSQVSGRGIGMDVIQSQIARMNGVVDLASKRGEGMRVTISLPSNQYDLPMILVKNDGRTYAISEHGVEHIFCALDGELVTGDDGALEYRAGDQRYPADTLEQLLGLGRLDGRPERSVGLLFRGFSGAERVVLVDQVIGYRSLMVRAFGDYLKGIFGVLGGVMLGSGQIAPAIDLFELLSDSDRAERASRAQAGLIVRQPVEQPLALVVDDSLSARKAAMLLLKDAGFEVQSAIDGLDAIERIEARRPDIILSDLEMPRMNGIELTRYLKSSAGFEDIPVIMITSRSTEKHRQQADGAGVALYLTKPFNDDDLIIKLNGLLGHRLTQVA